MQIAVLTFDGFNELDSFVPVTILNRMKPHGWAAYITSPTEQVTSMNGVVVQNQKPLEFATDADAVLIEQIVEATSKEPDTITYEYVVNAARTEMHIIERYRPQGLLTHVHQTFAPFADRFLALAKIERLYVYGETTPEIRETLDGFGAIYFTPVAGFSR